MANPRIVRGTAKLKARIASIRRNAAFALDDAVQEVGELLLRRTRERFLSGVDPDGNEWAPLKPATLRRKRYAPTKSQNRNRIGFSTGALFESISIIRGSHAGLFAVATGAGVRIGVANSGSFGPLERAGADIAKYARIFQKGRKGQAPRRFLGVGRLDIKAADSLIRNRMRRLLREAK